MVATRSQHRNPHRYALLKGNLRSGVGVSGTVTEGVATAGNVETWRIARFGQNYEDAGRS